MGSIFIFLDEKTQNLLHIAKLHLKRHLRKQTVRDHLLHLQDSLNSSEFKRINYVLP